MHTSYYHKSYHLVLRRNLKPEMRTVYAKREGYILYMLYYMLYYSGVSIASCSLWNNSQELFLTNFLSQRVHFYHFHLPNFSCHPHQDSTTGKQQKIIMSFLGSPHNV